MESSTGDKRFEQNMKIRISREKAVNVGKEMKIHFIVFRKDWGSNSILRQFCNSWIHTILILHRNTKRHTDTEIHREVSRHHNVLPEILIMEIWINNANWNKRLLYDNGLRLERVKEDCDQIREKWCKYGHMNLLC